MFGMLKGGRPRALPARLRRPRVLVVGCGDVGLRFARLHAPRARVFGTVRRDEAFGPLRAAGAVPLRADLDCPATLRRIAHVATRMVYLAPPPPHGATDPRLQALLSALLRPARAASMLARSPAPTPRWVYVSTTGIYGDRGGAVIDERCVPAPGTDRARRRIDAERRLRAAARPPAGVHAAAGRSRAAISILRAPGIYAADRLPVERLRRGTPALVDEQDSHSNHVHADDLARACWTALMRAPNGRTYNAVDASALKMGQWFDLVADATGLPRPPRLPRARIAAHVSPAMLTFMAESRRISGRRLTDELRVRLRWPTVHDFLATLSGTPGSLSPRPSKDPASPAS